MFGWSARLRMSTSLKNLVLSFMSLVMLSLSIVFIARFWLESLWTASLTYPWFKYLGAV